jgi:hypothetical protein
MHDSSACGSVTVHTTKHREDTLKVEPQGKLNNPRQVELSTDNPEHSIGLVCGVVAAKSAGLTKLYPVPHIERFRAKLQIDLFGNRRTFTYCCVPVGDALRTQGGIGTGLISETVVGWRGEATGIEPTILPGYSAAGQLLLATWNHVRPGLTGAELLVEKRRLGSEYQRETECVGGDSVDAPPAYDFIHDSGGIPQI